MGMFTSTKMLTSTRYLTILSLLLLGVAFAQESYTDRLRRRLVRGWGGPGSRNISTDRNRALSLNVGSEVVKAVKASAAMKEHEATKVTQWTQNRYTPNHNNLMDLGRVVEAVTNQSNIVTPPQSKSPSRSSNPSSPKPEDPKPPKPVMSALSKSTWKGFGKLKHKVPVAADFPELGS